METDSYNIGYSIGPNLCIMFCIIYVKKNELWFVFSKKKKTKGIGSYFVFIFAFTAWKMRKESAVLRMRMENGACSSEAQICMPGP